MPERKVIARTLDLELTGQQVKNLKHHYAGVVKHLEQKLPLIPGVLDNLQQELTGIVNLLPEWKKILEEIYHSGDYYRLLLRHRDNEILNLPWNMALDKNSGKILGSLQQLYLCKGISDYFKEETNFTTTAAPLKVLIMISAPEVQEIDEWFSYEDEELAILQALSPLMETGQVEVDFCEDGARETLEKRLIDCQYHILHFSGHGMFKTGKKQGYLVLEDAVTMKKHLVADRDFADSVNCNPDYLVPMVVLSSCQTAMGGSEETLRGVTNHLLRIGVPVVISMGMSIIDTYAAYFTVHLYGEMARKQKVFTAFHRAVEALRKKELQDKVNKKESPAVPLQWTIPNLYLSRPVERIVDWKVPKKKLALTSNRYIFEKDRLLLPHEKEYIFLDRRREKSEILSPLFRKTPILLKGQGGVGKTAFAEHLVQRLIAANPHIVPFVFNEKVKSIEDIFERLKDYLRDRGQVEAITKLIYFEKGLDKFIFLVFEINKTHAPVFIFDNLESFQQAPGEEFCDQYMDLKEIIAYLCRCQQFPVILTGRYPVPGLLNLQSLDLNQVKLTDFWKKSLYLQMGGIHAYLKEEERLRLEGPPYRGPLVFFDIVRLLHGTFGGNFRALEFFNRLIQENPHKIRGALESLESFREQSAEMAVEVREQMGQNLLFSRLMALLDGRQRELLALLSWFRVPVALMALEVQLKEQEKEWERLALDPTGLKTMLMQMHRLTLIEISLDPEITEIFYYVTPIVRDLLAAYEKGKKLPALVFSHQKAGDYFYHSFRNLKGGRTALKEAFYHYDLAGTDPEQLQEIGEKLTDFYYDISMFHDAFFYVHRIYEVLADDTKPSILNRLGLIHSLYGEYNKALTIYQKALLEFRREKDKSGEEATLNNISQIFDAQGNYDKALKYLMLSLKIAQENGDKAVEGTILNNIGQIFQAQNDYETALRYTEQSLAICRQLDNISVEGATLNNIGQIYQAKGDYDAALRYTEQSLAICRQLGNKSVEETTLNNIAGIYIAQSDYDTALKYMAQSLKICQQIGDKAGEGTILNNISQIYDAQGDYNTSQKYLVQSLKIAQEIGDKAGEGFVLDNISHIYYVRGDYDTALMHLERSLKIQQQIGDKAGEGTTRNNIGQIFSARGDYDKALMHLEQSLEIVQMIGDKSRKGTILNNISLIFKARGDYDSALKYLEQSLKIQQQIGDKAGEGTTLNNISLIYETRGVNDSALKYLEQSLKIQQQIGDKAGEGATLNSISLIYQKRGEYDIAQSYMEKSLEICRRLGNKMGEGATLTNLSQIFDARGDYETALKYLEQSLKISQQIGNQAGTIPILHNMAQIARKKDDLQRFLEYETTAYTIATRLNESMGIYHVGKELGYFLCQRGEKAKGIPMLKKSLEVGKATGFPDVAFVEERLKKVTGKK